MLFGGSTPISRETGTPAKARRERLRVICALVVAAGAVQAQTPGPTTPPLPTPLPPPRNAPDIDARRIELRGVEEDIDAAQEKSRKLESEIASHSAIREQLRRTLLEATQKLQQTEADAAAIEERLTKLSQDEQRVMQSLNGRRALIVEILTLLQRMGRRPPPAVL
ncbi:MAG: hypothetical protein N2444_09740, partial [Methylocystis sp.]|nr:hypothetical protein [Methylocystis sp.]